MAEALALQPRPETTRPVTCRIYRARCSCSSCARYGSTSNKIGSIQRRLAWPLRKDDTQIREALRIFGPNQGVRVRVRVRVRGRQMRL